MGIGVWNFGFRAYGACTIFTRVIVGLIGLVRFGLEYSDEIRSIRSCLNATGSLILTFKMIPNLLAGSK